MIESGMLMNRMSTAAVSASGGAVDIKDGGGAVAGDAGLWLDAGGDDRMIRLGCGGAGKASQVAAVSIEAMVIIISSGMGVVIDGSSQLLSADSIACGKQLANCSRWLTLVRQQVIYSYSHSLNEFAPCVKVEDFGQRMDYAALSVSFTGKGLFLIGIH
jgi:hypothetical protein